MNNITPSLLEEMKSIVGAAYFFTDEESFTKYGSDETEKLHYAPQVVVKPRSAEEISKLLILCNEHLIPVTPRGAGTGLTGGALPHLGGLVISMERFNTILNIDERNLQVTTEPGVITEVLQNTVKEKGLFYPPDPASKGSCFIGGNISENSGGPKAVKYGVVKDYVLNLEIVLPTGEIIWTGSNVLKNATGYNLTQLIVGSEGTLGIVTKIVLRLIPHPKFDLLMLAPFNSVEKASEAVSAIFRAGITPSAMELMEIDAITLASKLLESNAIALTENLAAHLIIEVDGNDMEVLMKDMEAIAEVLSQYEAGELYFADDAQQKNELWKIRRKANEAAVAAGYTIEEDTVVPRAELPRLIKGVKLLAHENGFKVVSYGHAGDGNLHIRINHPKYKKSYENEEIKAILIKIFELVKSLGGTISGEHGIGLIQKSFMPLMFDNVTMELMKSIKKVFDPNNILNAGKIFDSKK
ncbi:MAG: FAD-binding protein [Chitinophagia bacterium]|jgi:glycolate oxidase|nr:FAD-binding protein [Chitinophagia bacterium]NCA29408.1 FAD-binding protein [Chitinophagia bacterium]NDD16303.1 FAD-binding protein [Chitinophagia bacterium]